MSAATAAASGENKHVAVLLLESASHLVARALPPLGSGNSVDNVNSKTVNSVSRISNTIGVVRRITPRH